MLAVAGRSVHSETGQSARLDVAEWRALVRLRTRSESCEWQSQCSDLAAVAVQVSDNECVSALGCRLIQCRPRQTNSGAGRAALQPTVPAQRDSSRSQLRPATPSRTRTHTHERMGYEHTSPTGRDDWARICSRTNTVQFRFSFFSRHCSLRLTPTACAITTLGGGCRCDDGARRPQQQLPAARRMRRLQRPRLSVCRRREVAAALHRDVSATRSSAPSEVTSAHCRCFDRTAPAALSARLQIAHSHSHPTTPRPSLSAAFAPRATTSVAHRSTLSSSSRHVLGFEYPVSGEQAAGTTAGTHGHSASDDHDARSAGGAVRSDGFVALHSIPRDAV